MVELEGPENVKRRTVTARSWLCAQSSSIYKGVSYHKMSGKYIAGIRFCGQGVYLGCFDDETEAARAYDRKAVELFGEYAWLNFPEAWGRPPHRRKFAGA